MSKKFSILKSLDINKLDKQIDNYECETGEVPYLFMSSSTGNEMLKEVCTNCGSVIYASDAIEMLRVMHPGAVIGSYKGYKVYENNDLAFGEVEIR